MRNDPMNLNVAEQDESDDRFVTINISLERLVYDSTNAGVERRINHLAIVGDGPSFNELRDEMAEKIKESFEPPPALLLSDGHDEANRITQYARRAQWRSSCEARNDR